MTLVKVADNAMQAKQEIERLESQGYDRDEIYLFAHDKDVEKNLADTFDTETAGVGEQGLFGSMKNVVNKRGDELRSEMEAVGISQKEAAEYEEILDTGKLVLLAKK
ncbi:general stress protein [Planococcus lenghuensis]|uniref:General stress protein n=1 Tax=Planococcus lenghuensis TaxID=2213202 RepID=A0A1Q2KUU7_9BACL|nr:general stress protein [Planococcus lenghuensis]AQQ51913.1 general stress protein [Planococcus lenghuensis]